MGDAISSSNDDCRGDDGSESSGDEGGFWLVKDLEFIRVLCFMIRSISTSRSILADRDGLLMKESDNGKASSANGET